MNELAQSLLADKGWGPLSGMKVLDLTQSLAGPYGTQILADLGATVVKVEAVGRPDGTRTVGPYHAADTAKKHSGYFHSVNRNKHCVAIDLKTPEGKQLLFDLLEHFDILTENFRSGTMDKLGLSYEELSKRNPRLIYACVRGFGDPRSGGSPYENWPAFDVVAQAMGGINSVTGPDRDNPTKVGPGVGDIVPGMFMAMGVMAAVINREKTGLGQFIDVAMVDAILAISERIVYQHSFAKENPGPVGNHHPFAAPFGTFPTKDGHVSIGASGQNFFGVMCKALDVPEMADDPRFNSQSGRSVNARVLIDELSEVTRKYTNAELTERLGGKVPFGPVNTMADIAADPHFKQREMLAELQLDGVPEPVAVAGVPVKLSRTPGGVHMKGSDFAADTEALLESIGYSADKIAALKAARAVE